jgi:hypothetical protein
MALDFPFDDGLRPAGPQADWTETVWFSFHVAERSLAGGPYAQVRPNDGVCINTLLRWEIDGQEG